MYQCEIPGGRSTLICPWTTYNTCSITVCHIIPSSVSTDTTQKMLGFNHYPLGSNYLIFIDPDRRWDIGEKETFPTSLNYNNSGEKKTLHFINSSGKIS